MKPPFAASLFLGLVLSALAPAQAVEPLEVMNKAGCLACHQQEKKLVGPALTTVAAKYKGQDVAATAAALMQKVRAGSKGVYGPIPMPATLPDKISDADLKLAVDWILKL